jgi:hypothetical protein
VGCCDIPRLSVDLPAPGNATMRLRTGQWVPIAVIVSGRSTGHLERFEQWKATCPLT